MRAMLSCVGVAVAALAVAGGALAGPPGSWSKVTDPVSTNDEIGLARTADKILHVAWPKQAQPDLAEIWHTRIAPGGAVGGSNLISGGWRAAGGPDLLVTPSGLRAIFGGLCCSNERGGIQSAFSDASGSNWTQEPGRVSVSVRAAGTVGATLLADGTPAFSWNSSIPFFVKFGLDPNQGEQEIGPDPLCCFSWPELARDEATGVTHVAFGSIVRDMGGLFVQPVHPSLGERTLVPGSLTGESYVLVDQRLPLIAREGGGTYLAYCGGYPTCKRVLVWTVGGGNPLQVATASNVQDVNASRGSAKRLWVMWWNRDTDRIYATRSNTKATKFGAVAAVKLPPGTTQAWKLYGEGSLGPLDVVALAGDKPVFWHTQILPKLTVVCSRRNATTVRCIVTDAGDRVPGATVVYAGQKRTTGAGGTASFTSSSRTLRAKATKPGYTASGP